MSDESSTSSASKPATPKLSGLSLTEYTAAPTPPNERAQTKASGPSWDIPDTFLLPNGYPDVRTMPIAFSTLGINDLIAHTFEV